MKFLPWDRLQMTTSVFNHAPVRKTEIVYPLYRGFQSTFAHVPQYHRSLAVYAATHEDRVAVLENLAQDNEPVQRYATIAVFDIPGTLQDDGNRLEAAGKGFEYHEYRASFATLLGDLLAHRDQVRADSFAAGLAQSYHRHVYTIVINMDDTMSREVQLVPKIQAGLQELVEHSADENMSIIMLAGTPFMSDRRFYETFDQDAYLGEENMDFALDFYDDLDEGSVSMMQEHIGWGRRTKSFRLTSLHPRKYTPSQWVQEREDAIQAEEDAYADFLASLSAD